MSADPRMSVVLVTDRYETISGVVQRLARQTVADRIELVIVASSSAGAEADAADVAPFQGTGRRGGRHHAAGAVARRRMRRPRRRSSPSARPTRSRTPTGRGRCSPRSTRGSTVVVPGFANATRPERSAGRTSWRTTAAGAATSRRGRSGPPRLTTRASAATSSSGVGDRLDDLLLPRPSMRRGSVRDQGRAVWHEPRAVLYHVNVSRPSDLVRERFLSGRVRPSAAPARGAAPAASCTSPARR